MDDQDDKGKSWKNVPFKTWKYKEQTRKKHEVIQYYFPQWLRILGSWNKKVNYIDGFGGIGAYHNLKDIEQMEYHSKCYGSPISAIRSISDVIKQGKINNVNVLIIDIDEKNLQNIRVVLDYEKINLTNINIKFKKGDFDENINLILDQVKNLAPTFFIVDPFGYSQIKSNTLKRIMNHRQSEIILTFMYNAIQRWCKLPNQEAHFTNLFGSSDWKQYIDKRTEAKEQSLIKLFRNNCKKFANFVYAFRIRFPNKNMPFYYLVHLCNHRKGHILMKDSFAKFNMGELEYKGKESGQLNFFSEERTICKECLSKFINKKITYASLLDCVIDSVPYTERAFKKVLQDLEKENKIEIQANDRIRRGGINNSDVIFFKTM